MKKDIKEKTDSIAVWLVVALLVIVKVFFIQTLSWWIVLFPLTIALALWCFVCGILVLSLAVIVVGALFSLVGALFSAVFGKKI